MGARTLWPTDGRVRDVRDVRGGEVWRVDGEREEGKTAKGASPGCESHVFVLMDWACEAEDERCRNTLDLCAATRQG